VEADRHLRPDAGQAGASLTPPGAQAAGDDGEQDVVDGHVADQRAADLLQILKRCGDEREAALGTDLPIER
jgi:hypothetical protein